jgi:hypothetical protein
MTWTTISSLATAAGTLILAVATFYAVRSANRAARAAERSLLDGLRPLLMPSHPHDPPEKISFVDQHWLHVDGGHGAVEVADDVIYLAMTLRNVGRGMAVLHGWAGEGAATTSTHPDHFSLADFRRLTRDLYVPAGDLGFWQGALRDPSDPLFARVRDAVARSEPVTIELLYGDHEGGQRTISRFGLFPLQPEDGRTIWLSTVARHWNLDRAEPR